MEGVERVHDRPQPQLRAQFCIATTVSEIGCSHRDRLHLVDLEAAVRCVLHSFCYVIVVAYSHGSCVFSASCAREEPQCLFSLSNKDLPRRRLRPPHSLIKIQTMRSGTLTTTQSVMLRGPCPNCLKFMPNKDVTNEIGRKMSVIRFVVLVSWVTKLDSFCARFDA
jgi:hypothetical protein